MLKLLDVEAFYTVVKHKSFSVAARKLFISQSTISMRIKCLEDEVGMQLLVRNKSKVGLTYAGEVFYPYAEKFLVLKKEATEALLHLKTGSKGTFTIAVSAIISNWVLPYVLKKVYRGHPNIDIIYQTGFTSEIIPKVANGEVCFGIIRTDHPTFSDERFYNKLLGKDRIFFAANHHNKIFKLSGITLKDVSRLPLIVYGSNKNHWPYFKKIFSSLNLIPRDIIHLNDLGAIKKLTEFGTHICCLSEVAIQDEVKSGQLGIVPIVDYVPIYRYSTIIYRKDSEFLGALKEFLELINSLEMFDYSPIVKQ